MDLEMESNDQTKLTDLIEILKGKIVEKHEILKKQHLTSIEPVSMPLELFYKTNFIHE